MTGSWRFCGAGGVWVLLACWTLGAPAWAEDPALSPAVCVRDACYWASINAPDGPACGARGEPIALEKVKGRSSVSTLCASAEPAEACTVCRVEIRWIPSELGGEHLPDDAFEDGGAVCRHAAPKTGEPVTGRLTPGGCAIAKEGVQGSGNLFGHYGRGYGVLAEPEGDSTFRWRAWTGEPPTDAVVGGITRLGGRRYICRAPGIGVGVTTPDRVCKVRRLPLRDKPKVHTATAFEILVLEARN